MRSAFAALNAVADGSVPPDFTKGDALIAIHRIETQELAISALRLLVEQCEGMNDVGAPFYAALDHAKKLLKLHDDYVKKHAEAAQVASMIGHAVARTIADEAIQPAPNPVDSPAAKKPVADEDLSDLV